MTNQWKKRVIKESKQIGLPILSGLFTIVQIHNYQMAQKERCIAEKIAAGIFPRCPDLNNWGEVFVMLALPMAAALLGSLIPVATDYVLNKVENYRTNNRIRFWCNSQNNPTNDDKPIANLISAYLDVSNDPERDIVGSYINDMKNKF